MIKNNYFKYFLFLIPMLFIFNSNVFASSDSMVYMSYDFDNNNDFNMFYEMRNSSSLAEYLAENGNNLREILEGFHVVDSSSSDKSYYSIWLDKVDSDVTYSDSRYYVITLNYIRNGGDNSSTATHYTSINNYYFDKDMNYITYSNSTDSYYKLVLDFSSHPEFYFNYFAGNVSYYSNNSTLTYLHYIYVDSTKYVLSQVEQNYFSTISDYWKTHNWFTNTGYYDDSLLINLDYFKSHAVIGTNVELHPLHDTIYNFNDIDVDSSQYGKIQLNQYEKGVYLVPKSSSYDSSIMDVNFMYYTTNVDSFLKGGLVSFNSDGSLNTDITMVKNDSLQPYSLLKFNFASFFGSNLKANWYQYAYYFQTEQTAYDLYLFYDYDTYVPAYIGANGSVTLTNPETGVSSTLVSNDSVVDSMNNTINSNGYVSNSSGSYFESLKSDVSSSSADVKTDMTSILSYIGDSIAGISSGIKYIFSAFPEISSLIVFGLSALIVIGILKALF